MCGKATPGPWEIEDYWFGTDDDTEAGDGRLPVTIKGSGGASIIQSDEVSPFWNENQPDGAVAWANAALIAGCRTLIPALCDALEAEGERVRVLETENAEIRAANDELGEMCDLDPLRRASSEQIWAELDERCAPFSSSQKVADLRRARARLYRDISAEREKVRQGSEVLAELWEYAMRLEGVALAFAYSHSYVTMPQCAPDLMERIKAALAATEDGGGP
jgi:hypothetical protein